MNPTRFVLAFTAGVAVAGCSTFAMGTSQEIVVLTPDADHAICIVSEQSGEVVASVTTPGVVRLSRSRRAVQLNCRNERYQAATVTIRSKFASASKVQVPVGYLVDGASGAMWEYPSKVVVAMTPTSAPVPESVADSRRAASN